PSTKADLNAPSALRRGRQGVERLGREGEDRLLLGGRRVGVGRALEHEAEESALAFALEGERRLRAVLRDLHGVASAPTARAASRSSRTAASSAGTSTGFTRYR